MNRTLPAAALALVPLVIAVLFPSSSRGGGLGVSAAPDSLDSTIQTADLPFHQYKVPSNRDPHANRDIEFLWSDTYRANNKPLVPPGNPSVNDLDRLGITQCGTFSNPFGFPFSDIQMIYDYFNVPVPGFREPLYEAINLSEPGFRVSAQGDPSNENEHADVYLWLKGVDDAGLPGAYQYSSYPSNWSVIAEDSVTSYPSNYFRNSFDLIGPTLAEVGDTNDETRWTRSGSIQNAGFNHEFQHAVNTDQLVSFPFVPYLHMFSSAAEFIGGFAKDLPRFDAPFTWSLFRTDANGGNYQAWQSFTAYLAFNFRGTDTTSSGRSDDLLWRWAHKPERSLAALAPALSPGECAECETPARSYFEGLPAIDRFHLVHHNWRVACFVNRSSLAQGQYGVPPQFGFDPIKDIGYWQNVDPGATDSVNIPHEISVTNGQRTRDLSFAGPWGGAKRHAIGLERLGSDYWEVGSDPSIQGANHDLVVRASAQGALVGNRIMVSAITYSQLPAAGDSLWKHPEWATGVIGPQTVILSPGNEVNELLVPNFGQTHRAVIIVITLSDDLASSGFNYALPYRLNLALRSGTYQSPNPIAVQTQSTFDGSPAWSPAGDEIAYMRVAANLAQIFRKKLDGSPAVPLVPQFAGQFRPDWSPRGDWVTFDQETTPSNCDIYAYNLGTAELRRLTTASQHEFEPMFSPNGQRLAYLRVYSDPARYELRHVDLNGGVTSDSLLVTRYTSSGPGTEAPRWSPDGQLIFFIAGDSLYSVGAIGPAKGTVVFHRRLPNSTRTIHLPLGAQRIALQFLRAGLGEGIAARDTTIDESELLFYRSSANFYDPRWSFDGTRVAYSSDQNTPGGQRDIFMGQVSYNHAPQFAAGSLGDGEVAEGFPLSFGLGATDSDGEAVSYEAVYLPPGAALSPTGYFHWPYPSPAGAEYYVVFRALDPSGGVDNRVVKYTVVPGQAGGCPYVDTRTALGWQVENSILSRSLTASPGLDAYRLKATPVTNNGHYQVRLRENEQELTTLDQVGMVTVDHPPGVKSYYVGGEVVLGNRAPAVCVTRANGEDITALVNGSGSGYQGQAGDTLLVQLTSNPSGTFGAQSTLDCLNCPPGVLEGGEKEEQALWRPSPETRARPAGAAYDQAVLTGTGILVQVSDGQGGWRTVKHHYPRAHLDEATIDTVTAGQMRLVFVGRHRVTFIGRLERSAASLERHLLSPVSAAHSRLGNVRGAVSGSGGLSTVLAPDDTLTLEFSAPPLAEGWEREWFVMSTGVYTSALPSQLEPASTPPVPARFALRQNQPNPFATSTTIAFDLPVPARVRLEVFDLLGRRIRTLADGEHPAGFHSLAWDRRGGDGAAVRPGVYVYRLVAGEFQEQRKMVLLP